jgi:hypothetical protein
MCKNLEIFKGCIHPHHKPSMLTIECLLKGMHYSIGLLSMGNKITQDPTRQCLQGMHNFLRDHTKDKHTNLLKKEMLERENVQEHKL